MNHRAQLHALTLAALTLAALVLIAGAITTNHELLGTAVAIMLMLVIPQLLKRRLAAQYRESATDAPPQTLPAE